MRVVVCITGASGAIYAIKLLERLKCQKDLVVSEHGLEVIKQELDLEISAIKKKGTRFYTNDNMNCDIASGRTKFDAVVVVPCSMNTLSKIASGICDNLITRVSTVALKERRKLILVPRETPMNPIHLEKMVQLASIGVVILPASPAFYLKPKSINDLVDFIVDRIIAALNISNL